MAAVALTPLGAILRARGLKGELLLQIDPQRYLLKEPKILWLGEDSLHLSPWDVEYLHINQPYAFLKLREVKTRREAEFLRGLLVFAHSTEIQTPQWEQIVGYQVVTPNCPEIKGEIVGLDYCSNQIKLVLRLKDQRELLFPAVDELIVAIDKQQRLVTLKLLDELIRL